MPLGSPITRAAAVSRPLRAVLRVFTRHEKTQTRRRLLVTAGAFQLLAIALAIGLNVSGLKNGPGPSILAPYSNLISVRLPLVPFNVRIIDKS